MFGCLNKNPNFFDGVFYLNFGVLIVSLISSSSSQIQIDLDCQPGWQLIGHGCYKFYSNLSPWTSAARVCKSYGGHLATPNDYQENEDVGKFVNDQNVAQFWIGADRVGIPPNDRRVLKYSDSKEVRMWRGRWAVDEPSFDTGDCALLQSNANSTRGGQMVAGRQRWKLTSCDTKLAFLCQRPVCSKGSFHCANGQCVNPSLKCDGDDDCGDNSDELDCPDRCTQKVMVQNSGTYDFLSMFRNVNIGNADCLLALEADVGENIEVKIDSLNLEANIEELVILDNGQTLDSSRVVTRLRESLTGPRFFYSSNNMMTLNFLSTRAGSIGNFQVTFRTVTPASDYPGLVILPRNILTATDQDQELGDPPLYSSYELGSQDLTYIIEAENPRKTITVEILEQDLAPDTRVTFRDGDSVSSKVLATLRGTYSGNHFILSSGPKLYLTKQTILGGPYKGIKLRYKQGCNVQINQTSGYISSPGFPVNYYPKAVECNWSIMQSEGQPLTLKFDSMNIRPEDTLKILDENSTVLKTYSGSALQHPLRIPNGRFSAIFKTNPYFNQAGFNLTFSYDCPQPDLDLSRSIITPVVSTSFGSSFTVSCEQGSTFLQEEHKDETQVTMICEAWGRWNVNTSPKCMRVLCPKAPGIANGYVAASTGSLAYQGTITYKCFEGFTITGSATVTCQADGAWTELPTCTTSRCNPIPRGPDNGQITVEGEGTSYGSIVRFSCDPGFDLIGDTTMFCDTSGQWLNGNIPECRILQCYTPDVPNGKLSANTVDYQGTITLTCDPGYTTSINAITDMSCNADRTLTPKLTCIDINECIETLPCNMTCINTPGSYRCECGAGYVVQGNDCIDIDECNRFSPCDQRCSNLPGTFQCSCGEGYVLFDEDGVENHYLPIGEDGTRDGDKYLINRTCVPKECRPPVIPANSQQLVQGPSYYYNDSVEFKCGLGYHLVNPSSGRLVCGPNGTWQGPQITCKRVMCDVEPLNATDFVNPGILSPANEISIEFGGRLAILCNVPGLSPTPKFTRYRHCTLLNGQYRLDGSVQDYECGVISCGQPDRLPGDVYSNRTGAQYRDIATFGCEDHFTLSGASSALNSTTITCQADGQWDLGSLLCTGMRCSDPGQIHLGVQKRSDYRNQVVFECTRPGFELRPPGPLACEVNSNGTASYNSSLPVCVDVNPPVLQSPCANGSITLDLPKYVSVGDSIPTITAIDRETGIKSLVIDPAPPSKQEFLTSAAQSMEFTYIFSDFADNVAECKVYINGRDTTKPSITCPSSVVKTFNNQHDEILLSFSKDNVTVSDDFSQGDNIKVTFEPSSLVFKTSDLQLKSPLASSLLQEVQATAMDAAGNNASCKFDLLFTPDVCSQYYIRDNEHVSLACQDTDPGVTCTATCDPGYRLYEDPNFSAVTFSCSGPGQPFNRNTDITCINYASKQYEGAYHLLFDATYNSSSANTSCSSNYQSVINGTLISLGEKIISLMCREELTIPVSGYGKLASLNVDEARSQVKVVYEVLFNRRPGTNYQTCSKTQQSYLEDAKLYKDLEGLTVFSSSQCPSLTLEGMTLVSEGYFCPGDSNRTPSYVQDGDITIGLCLQCPEGTYKAYNSSCVRCPRGTYSSVKDASICTACPSGTSTYRDGAITRTECTGECEAGTYNADTGLPPCAACPKDTFWVNATTCLACPGEQVTKVAGASSSDACVGKCPVGYFNEYDGHYPCRKCPLHTYTSVNGTKQCTSCNSGQYTESDGSTASTDCIDLTNSEECRSRCVNGQCRNNMHSQSCVCNTGWSGENCTIAYDPCKSIPCYNGGNCSSMGVQYNCSCPAGTTGSRCEEIIPTCTAESCFNGGMCENLVGGPRCHCLPGFSGPRCNISEDLCSQKPCGMNGRCIPHDNVRFSCACLPGYTGNFCEKLQDQCYTKPCQNDATCQTTAKYTFSCDCSSSPGYNGTNCETRQKQCDTGSQCGAGAWCVENEVEDSYICVCPTGSQYKDPSGLRSQTCEPINFCQSSPCVNGGTCRSESTGFVCTCPAGYDGARCQYDIDDCASFPCLHDGVCTDKLLGYNCSCLGYTGFNCETKINECTPNNCNATGTAQCIDKVGSFECKCHSGYTGDYCQTDVNECASSPCLHGGRCIDDVANYTCDCPMGWTGTDCEQEVQHCTSDPCQNGAECKDLFNDFFCRCQLNTFGSTCSESVKICNVSNPCVHGTCKDDGGNVTCACSDDYIGDRCQERINPCSTTSGVCHNDALCVPSLDNFQCRCEPGFAGSLCAEIPSSCTPNECPSQATCIDLPGKSVCRCPLGKEGPSCAYAIDSNFDLLFRNSDKTSMAALQYPISVSPSSFSVSMWIQFAEKSDQGVFFSIFTVLSPNSLKGKTPLLTMDESGVIYRDPLSGDEYFVGLPIAAINDGGWHYLVVNVDGATGQISYIADTVRNSTVTIPQRIFDLNLWVVLGCEYNVATNAPMEGKGFYGKLSRVIVYQRTLLFAEEVTNVGNLNVSAVFSGSILQWGLEYSLLGGVKRLAPSVADASCPAGFTGQECRTRIPGKTKVTISGGQCPANILQYSPERLIEVKYDVPTFTGQETVKTSLSPEDVYVWGRYPVVIEASNNAGNKALCLFNIYVQNDQCTLPSTPPGAKDLLCLPMTRANYTAVGYQQCGINCQIGYSPSIPGPHLHTCGPSSNWDPENKFVPYRLSPCGSVTKPKQNLVVLIGYHVTTIECEPVKFSFENQVRKTQMALNKLWNQVCSQNDCSDSGIVVACDNMQQTSGAAPLEISVQLTLPNINDTVTSRNNSQLSIPIESLYNGLLLTGAGNIFDYSNFVAGAIPNSHTVTIVGLCDEPRVFIKGECVSCGLGTFYNNQTGTCEYCPVGTYQTVEGQTSCLPCPDSTTTQSIGSYRRSDCKVKCNPGNYFDTSTDQCQNCSRGFYQPTSDQFYCLACDADKTTMYPGTIQKANCFNDCPPGQEIGPYNDCVACTIGFYRSTNDALCQRCPSGRVTRSNMSSSLEDCDVADNPQGTYRDQADPTKFSPCPVDQYQPDRWQFQCLPCPVDFRAETEGATSESQCKFYCAPGKQVKVTENVCEPCPIGTYRDGSKVFEPCDSCPSLYTTLTDGAQSKSDCSLFRCSTGSQPNSNQTGCDLCPRGQYQALANQARCDSCPSGQSTRQEGSTDQATCEAYCPPGQEKINGTCKECDVGYFKSNDLDVFSTCRRCENSKYVTKTTGATSNDNCTVLNCAEGYKANVATEQCEACPRGSYQDKKYQTSCIPCSGNNYTRFNASTSENDCESYCSPGYEKVGGACKACPRGYYKNNQDDVFMPCTECQNGFVTPAGTPATHISNCTVPDCKPGTYISQDQCLQCPKGQWQNESWSESCNSCPKDKDTAGEGADSIALCLLSCPAGQENRPNTEVCDLCPVGYYKDKDGIEFCTPCGNFSKNNIRISTSPGANDIIQCNELVCLPGYYPRGLSCAACPYGQFQPNRWKVACDLCPIGTTTYRTAADESTDCEPECPSGEGLVNGQCKICPVGQYRDSRDSTLRTCLECSRGSITGREGATSVAECNITDCSEPGTYRNSTSNSCANCPVGQYQDTPRQDACKSCPDGYTTRYVRSANPQDCKKDCPAGQQLDNTNDQCEPCPKGSYRSKAAGEDTWACQQCGIHLTTVETGADQSTDCNVPTCTPGHGYDRALKTCIQCPVNTFQSRPGQYMPCESCPDNQITTSTAIIARSDCFLPCSADTSLCSVQTQVCVNDANSTGGYRCDCKDSYLLVGDKCTHKCNISNYCGDKGVCQVSPFQCLCSDGYTGEQCGIRPAAASQSDDKIETLVIAIVATVCGLLFLLLIIVCLCVIAKRKATPTSSKSTTPSFDERASVASRSMKGYDDFPTFAINPAFNSKPSFSVFGTSMNGQNMQIYSNDVSFSDEDPNVAVYNP